MFFCGVALLHSPDFSRPFVLYTNVSDIVLGAVLSRVVEGEDISRMLTGRESKYSMTEKEFLAINWVVLTLQYYHLGCPFILCSDHAPLHWLH